MAPRAIALMQKVDWRDRETRMNTNVIQHANQLDTLQISDSMLGTI